MRELVRQKTVKRQKSANKTRRYNNQKLDKDDFVRVKLSNFQSGVRLLLKVVKQRKFLLGTTKYILLKKLSKLNKVISDFHYIY